VDTLSGRDVSLDMIDTGVFEGVFSDLNLASDGLPEEIAPAALEKGMSIFTREVFVKAQLFKLGEKAGIPDRSKLARALIRWVLSHGLAAVVVLGVANADLLKQNLETAASPELTDEDRELLEKLKNHPEFKAFQEARRSFFNQGMV
jgi:aryl-alcohol dehydrogenase-like predicted oxidoreductase